MASVPPPLLPLEPWRITHHHPPAVRAPAALLGSIPGLPIGSPPHLLHEHNHWPQPQHCSWALHRPADLPSPLCSSATISTSASATCLLHFLVVGAHPRPLCFDMPGPRCHLSFPSALPLLFLVICNVYFSSFLSGLQSDMRVPFSQLGEIDALGSTMIKGISNAFEELHLSFNSYIAHESGLNGG